MSGRVSPMSISSERMDEQEQLGLRQVVNGDSITEIVQTLSFGISSARVEATQKLVSLLDSVDVATVDDILVRFELLLVLVANLQRYDNPELQNSTVACLFNFLTLGEPIPMRFIQYDVHSALIGLGESNNNSLLRMGDSSLNIIFQSVAAHERLIWECCQSVIAAIYPMESANYARYVSMICASLCACVCESHQGRMLVPYAVQFLYSSDLEVQDHGARAVRNLLTNNADVLSELLDQCVLHRLHELLVTPSYVRRSDSILRIITQIIKSDDPRVDAIMNWVPLYVSYLDERLLPALACVLLGTLMDRPSRIQVVIDTGVIPRLLECLTSHSLWLRSQAAVAINNLLHRGSDAQIQYAINVGCVPWLVGAIIGGPLAPSTVPILDSIDAILRYGDRTSPDEEENTYCHPLRKAGFLDAIKALGNSDAKARAKEIIAHYFTQSSH